MKYRHGVFLPDSDTYFEKHLDHMGMFQADHLEFALRQFTARGVAVDIGAHVGTWSLALAREFRYVIAVEPDPQTYRCLIANTGDCPRIRAIRAALGATPGRCSSYSDPTRPGNTGAHFVAYDVPGAEIPVLTLDKLIRDEGVHVDFVKLDVEGAEEDVILGGQASFLKQRPTIMMEVKDLGRGGDFRAADKRLRSLGAKEVGRVGKDVLYRWE